MLVSVTGGTGLLGGHTVAALLRRGHRVRLLVRDEHRAARALAVLGVKDDEVERVTGDVTDPGAADRLVRGADAVLHAAGVYSFHPRRRAEVRRVNEAGTRRVLDAAVGAVAGPIVHVSTFGVLEPDAARRVTPGSPVARPREAYLASKAAADRVARRHQDAGAPVTITYPPALLGPADPALGDQTTRLRAVLRGLTPLWPTGGFPLGDVRDAAETHADLLTGGPQPGARHLTPGRYVPTHAYLAAVRAATGRALPALRLPARALLPAGVLADTAQRWWPWHIPVEYGALYVCARDVRTPAADGRRPLAETVADTVGWLHGAGLLTDRQAGTAAGRTTKR
ncbi:SDR family NAD(P)-dependent oxidoreductase [Actinomadura flavalba]|uniref:SDR family NAD(P)-dependent oxidoreductase n=1 Tax=Actinomadura flavalba TaxID=1120938 RepID=UPI000378DE67|nr:SDR family NAD(P)-dependent oxidoreductase [Actinomadura flavalba]